MLTKIYDAGSGTRPAGLFAAGLFADVVAAATEVGAVFALYVTGAEKEWSSDACCQDERVFSQGNGACCAAGRLPANRRGSDRPISASQRRESRAWNFFTLRRMEGLP